MSFGGRGGRGGSGRGLAQRQLPFGLDYSDVGTNQTSDKPQISMPVNGIPMKFEKVFASHFISFQAEVKDGPFYTGSSLDFEGSKVKKLEIDEDGINDGLKRYSDKYLKKRKIGRSIDEHPYNIEFFPQELYKVMGVDDKKKKKLLSISQLKNSSEVLQLIENDTNSKDMLLEKLKELESVAEDDTSATKNNDDANEVEDDDEFEDEDDDDDYNAEKYFDDGDEFGDEDDYNDQEAEF